jgi:hypothetical protein
VNRLGRRLAVALGLVAALALPGGVAANHSWGGYHWARTVNPFTLNLGDNVSSAWDPILGTTSSDWSQSTVLDTTIVAGGARPRNCRPTAGRDEICNATYGNTGWLGVAQIWITGGTHITQGTVKVNDTYFNTPTYNSTAWRNLVMCQEVGHTFGLDHQDTNFDNPNLGTCMDYTNDPSTNQHPNAGDYDELLCIYDPASAGKTLSTSTHSCVGTGHLDSTTTLGQSTKGAGAASVVGNGWGREVSRSRGGHTSVFVRDLGAGSGLVTFVIWAG